MDEVFANESLEFYARVRKEQGISITSVTKEVIEGLVIYTAVGRMGDREDSASGAASLEGLTSLAKADAFKSAETQAKGRLTISLSGIRMPNRATSGPAAAEPVVDALPEVNHAPANVVEDVRITALVPENPSVEHLQTTPFPVVSEEQVASVHREVEALGRQFVEDVRFKAAIAASTTEQPGMFDESPEPLTVAPPQAPPPAPVVDAVLAACQEATATGVVMPVPIEKPVDQPTRLQYQAFTLRCTKLVRDKLPKAGKDAPNALLPFLKKVFAVKDLTAESTSIKLWESTLARLEAASPAEAFLILKGTV